MVTGIEGMAPNIGHLEKVAQFSKIFQKIVTQVVSGAEKFCDTGFRLNRVNLA